MIGAAVLAVTLLFACAADDESPPADPLAEGGTTPTGDGGQPGVDAAPRREAGVPTKCATYAGATVSDTCACGETEPPFGGPATDACPIADAGANPYYCISYDVVDPPPLRRECTCQPKCLFQRVTGGGGEAGANEDTCRCGVASFLKLGGNGSIDETRASCDGFTVCCRFSTGCDCTSNAGYVCPTDSTKVPSCGPSDFNEKNWKALVYGSPSFTDLVDVPKCR